MPSLLGYVERKGELPKHLTFSIAALMAFYTGSEIRDKVLIGNRDGKEYEIHDDAAVLEFFAANSSKATAEFVHAYLSNVDFHGQDLTLISGLEAAVVAYLDDIRTLGMRKAIEKNF
jgi:tagaturonate reductase